MSMFDFKNIEPLLSKADKPDMLLKKVNESFKKIQVQIDELNKELKRLSDLHP